MIDIRIINICCQIVSYSGSQKTCVTTVNEMQDKSKKTYVQSSISSSFLRLPIND